MNLITDPWITGIRRSGEHCLIRPAEIVSNMDDPIIDLHCERPDHRGALYQFLIGLLQSTCDAVESEHAWKQLLNAPPSVHELDTWFAPITQAFELIGDGPRFMQDQALRDAETQAINGLFIEAPTGKTLKDHADHFVKRDMFGALSLRAAAATLFALQTNAPAGGVGYRTGLRGGGPLTTLVMSKDDVEDEPAPLWRHLWLNVLPRQAFLDDHQFDRNGDIATRFPWMGPTRVSDKTGEPTHPQDVHKDQIFWAMPRRIWLDHQQQEGSCAVTAEPISEQITGFSATNYGVNYEGEWVHPLSPHKKSKEGLLLPLHPQPGGMGYRHWHALAVGGGDSQIASVLYKFQQRRLRGRYGLWAFGHDMDNMKARGWYESTMPLFYVPPHAQSELDQTIAEMINGATLVAKYLRDAIKQAWFKPKASVQGDTSFIASAFWQQTESPFFAHLQALATTLETAETLGASTSQAVKWEWYTTIRNAALALFDQWGAGAGVEFAKTRQVSDAYNKLGKLLGGSALKEKTLNLKDQKETADAA